MDKDEMSKMSWSDEDKIRVLPAPKGNIGSDTDNHLLPPVSMNVDNAAWTMMLQYWKYWESTLVVG